MGCMGWMDPYRTQMEVALVHTEKLEVDWMDELDPYNP